SLAHRALLAVAGIATLRCVVLQCVAVFVPLGSGSAADGVVIAYAATTVALRVPGGCPLPSPVERLDALLDEAERTTFQANRHGASRRAFVTDGFRPPVGLLRLAGARKSPHSAG